MKLSNCKLAGVAAVIVAIAICIWFEANPGSVPSLPSDKINQPKPVPTRISAPPQQAQAIPTTAVVPVANQATALVLNVAGLALPLAFADTATDKAFCQMVARDLQLIYGHLTGHEVIRANPATRVMVRGKTITPIKMLNFTGKGRYFPKSIEADFGYVGIVDGHESLLITDQMVSAYREALKLQQQQPQAIEELSHFVDALNGLSARPMDNVRSLFLLDASMASGEGELAKLTPQSFSQSFGSKQYRSPSVLELVAGEQVGDRYKGRFITKLYIKTSSGIEDAMPPLIFDGGRWKFLITSNPT